MEQKADDEGGGYHEPDGQGQHWLTLAPEGLLVGVLRLVVEQRRDEHDQEELGIEGNLHIAASHKRDNEPDGDLDERQRYAGDDLIDEGGCQHGGKQEQAEGQGFHRCISFGTQVDGSTLL